MGWWFGRKSAPADARPFVPAWLQQTSAAEEGFARSVEGMSLFVRSAALWAVFRSGAWEMGLVRGDALLIGGEQVVGGRAAAIASPAGGVTVDGEARIAIDAILGALREHGLIAI